LELMAVLKLASSSTTITLSVKPEANKKLSTMQSNLNNE
jgi:hypothetical protein